MNPSKGPLSGLKIVELAGIGPGPMCAMLLADLGATVLRIDRLEPSGLGIPRPLKSNLLLRNRHSVTLDLKTPQGVDAALSLIAKSDALIEGFRPGVTERLGLGPDVCLQRNPRLVYGRMTGWGQTGPLAQRAGHDINYLALTGVLNAIGRKGAAPSIPLNLLGDYAGGSLYLAVGIMAGVFEAQRSGIGQVVDAAIVDGAAHLATSVFGMVGAGMWNEARGTNIVDSGAFFYDVYQCADGKWISIGPIEKKFLEQLLRLLQVDPALLTQQNAPDGSDRSRKVLEGVFQSNTQAHWIELLQDTDACFAPVLSWTEAPEHPHLEARKTFVEIDGIKQPAPAPRFSRTPPPLPTAPKEADSNIEAALSPFLSATEIAGLRQAGTIR